MKKVFSSNSEVAHIWANETQTHGRASSVSFEYGVLFSYQTAIAQIINDTVILNDYGYSPSTRKHQGYANSAIHGKTKIFVTIPRRNLSSLKFAQREFDEIIVSYNEDRANDLLVKASRARKNRDWYLSDANIIYKSIKQYADFFGLTYDLPADINELENAAVAAAKHRAEVEKQKRAQTIADQAENLEKWRKGEDVRVNFEITALRLKDEIIETTKGANIPADHARKIWPLLAKLKQSGETYTRGQKSHNLGHYVINSFDGVNLTVGCHVIPWPEIANMAEALKIG
jgi:hypothetical protein